MIKITKEKLLIEPKDIIPSSRKLEVIGVLNPSAVRLDDGNILLYVRVIERLKKIQDRSHFYSPRLVGRKRYRMKIDKFSKKDIVYDSDLDFVFKDNTKRLTFISHLRRVWLDKTGFNIIKIDKKPSFFGTRKYGELGVEDSRITKIENKYVMTYVGLSRNENISTYLAVSEDCMNWDKKGIIFGEQDKDVVIFPEKIKDKYVAFDRPEGNFQFSLPHIWIAYSDDLEEWGNLKSITLTKKGDVDYGRNGAGPPPIKTKKGWLLLYHSVSNYRGTKKELEFIEEAKKYFDITDDLLKKITIYSVGAVLFDLKNPEKIIAKSEKPIILPSHDYDVGSFEDKKVTFPTGLVLDRTKKNVLIYSGGGDVVTTVKKIKLEDILNSLKKHKKVK